MKTFKLSIALLLISLILSTSAHAGLTKALTCKRKVDLMFGDFSQGDLIYVDVYLDAQKRFDLEVVSETNQVLVKAAAADNTYSSSDLSQSIIAASWNIDQVPVELRLAYFGGVNWMGLVNFPMGFEGNRYHLQAGAELEISCRELNLAPLE